MIWRHAVVFAAGALIGVAMPWLPPLWAVLALASIAALAALLLPGLRMFVALLLGLCWFTAHAQHQIGAAWPEHRAGEELRVTGRVVGLPESRGQSVRFILAPVGDSRADLPARIQVSWFRPGEYLRPGEVWVFDLSLNPAHGRLNPGGFDLERHLLSERIGALGTVRGRPKQLASGGWRGRVDRQRQILAERLQAETVRLEHAALLRALGLADRSALDGEWRDLLRRTGTAHLLAISGLHVGMVAGLSALLAGWLLSPMLLWHNGLDRRRLAIWAGLVAALAYAWLAGFTLPTVRALIMLSVAAAALTLRRGIRPAQALLLALLAVLLIDPMAPLATGFWLSFLAVTILIWAFAWRPGQSSGGWLKGLVIAQLVIAIGMLPLNVGVFGQWIPGALVANLVAIPLVGLWVLPWLLLALVLLLLGLPAGIPIAAAEFGLSLLLQMLQWVDLQRWSHWEAATGGVGTLILGVFGALWLLAPRGWPARWLGAVLMLPLLVPRVAPGEPGALTLWMLDVGDGQVIVLESGGMRVLYDTGPGDGEGGDALSGLMRGVGAGSRPDLHGLVIARPHRGHAGGFGSAREWTSPLRVRAAPGGSFERTCQAGERWSLGRYQLSFLHPSAALPDLGDNSSCVLLVEGPGGAILLTGAVDGQVEQRLLLEQPRLQTDVLVLAAGGHRRGASGEFLDQVSPGLALASVARHDRFGRPHDEVIERLQARDIELLTTGQCGAIRVRLRPGRATEVRSERSRRHRFWLPANGCP